MLLRRDLMNRHRRHQLAVVLAIATTLTACSDSTSEPASAAPSLSAETASFDLAAGVDQRYLLGIFSDDGGSVVDGTISLDFVYLDGEIPDDPAIQDVPAEFLPVAGSDERAIADAPHVADPGDGTGAYRTGDIRFDRPGNWEVRATVEIDGDTVTVDEAFEVQPDQVVPSAGEPAPLTENRTVEDTDVESTSIDSRADNGILPDPELHHQTIAAAIASGRPTMIVVSTPTYCVSRFCGPITDTVQSLATDYPGVNFVHLEVWNDYEAQSVNAAAAEWILPDGPDGGGGNEPWVFLIGGDGTIAQRWDNVTNAAELSAALDATV